MTQVFNKNTTDSDQSKRMIHKLIHGDKGNNSEILRK